MVCHVCIISYGPYTVVAGAIKIVEMHPSITQCLIIILFFSCPGLSFRVGGQGFSPDSLPPATFIENQTKMEPKQPVGCSL